MPDLSTKSPVRRRRTPPDAAPVGARDRLAARVAGIGGAPASLVFTPGVFQIGDASVAARLAAGRLRLAGVEVDLGDAADPWDVAPPTPEWEASLHGFDWLDHYAASGAPWVREALAGWIHAWIARCGRGAGPGWKAEIAGRRAAAWARSGRRIVEQASPADGRAFLRAFARNVRFLRRRWRAAPQGLPRCRAVAGLVHGALALYGPADPRVDEAAEALAEAARGLHADGAPSRAPEDLAIVFAVLVAARRALGESGRMAAPAHEAALAALAADIRALRHPDGSLVRAQGGGAGDEAAIDHSLALLEAPSGARAEAPMGYRRIASGRAVVFLDAGPAPSAPTTGAPFLGLFSLEASFDREPIVVSCGPGARIGAQWRRPCRAAAAHSSLTFDEADAEAEEAALALAPADIASEVERDAGAVRLAAVHDGWLKRFGLTHRRSLTLASDGLDFRGEDRLEALGPGPRAAFDQAAGVGDRMRLPFTIRFHLHPDVEAELFLAGGAVRLRPPSGEDWVMRQLGGALNLEESVYLDERRGAPRATKQIVVRADAADYRGLVKWAFRRADTHLRGKPAAAEAGSGGF